MTRNFLLVCAVLFGLLFTFPLVHVTNAKGIVTLDLILTNETQKFTAISKLGITPPDTGCG
ncbi:hypothetical protein BMS3Abin16_00302 [archaeon BMS3Abin16]|nr:hypothetical protein BMS3Abin16_00302 [archaeon BMS3Abin16]